MFICLKGTNTGKAQIKWHLRNDWNPLPTDADNFIFVTTASSLSYAPGAVVNPSAICGGLQIKDQVSFAYCCPPLKELKMNINFWFCIRKSMPGVFF